MPSFRQLFSKIMSSHVLTQPILPLMALFQVKGKAMLLLLLESPNMSFWSGKLPNILLYYTILSNTVLYILEFSLSLNVKATPMYIGTQDSTRLWL